jgi:hypothetical protein
MIVYQFGFPLTPGQVHKFDTLREPKIDFGPVSETLNNAAGLPSTFEAEKSPLDHHPFPV